MSNEIGPSLAFRWYSALCIFYLALVAWWAFLIVGPERYSLAQWAAIAFLPPLAVIIRGVFLTWFWGRRGYVRVYAWIYAPKTWFWGGFRKR